MNDIERELAAPIVAALERGIALQRHTNGVVKLSPGERILNRREIEAMFRRPRRCLNCRIPLQFGIALCLDCIRAILVGAILAGGGMAWAFLRGIGR